MQNTNLETSTKNTADNALPIGNTGKLTSTLSEKKIENESGLTEKKEEKKSMENKENITNQIPMVRSNNEIAGTNGSLIESFEPQQTYFQKELSADMTLLNESTKLLHTHTKSLLVKEEPAVRKASDWEVREARLNMGTMAMLIQTKLNVMKSIKQNNQ